MRLNLGGNTEGETPGTIPNPEVKLFEADDTAPLGSGKVGSCLGSFFCFFPPEIIFLFFFVRPVMDFQLFLLSCLPHISRTKNVKN